ncbi:NACHT domain-containing protein [Streptomyces sp. NPDC102270]|uniref:NACHT domain-containing protein n=1 Tax=Streptomyces sp. NPDC102270 TaxID=3366150 RepID=UPI00381430C2
MYSNKRVSASLKRWRRHGIWLGAAAAAGIVVIQTWGERDNPASVTAVLGFGVSVVGLAVNLWRESVARERTEETLSQERLQNLANRLASAVQEQWQAEWRLRRLQDPSPLQVQWAPAEEWLADEWDGGSRTAGPEGELEGVADVFDTVPSRRMVVLGGPGSGKTVLAVRFTLDKLAQRASGDPVPVVFPLAGWQPDRERLRDWMSAHMRTTYPGAHWSRDLLEAGLVLPVLDGLDEMAESLCGAALQRLNAELDPGQSVLLTCRTQTYVKAVESGNVFAQAAVVELQPLAFTSVSAYLVRTARPVRGAGGKRTTRWDPIFAYLREFDGGDGPGRLRRCGPGPGRTSREAVRRSGRAGAASAGGVRAGRPRRQPICRTRA